MIEGILEPALLLVLRESGGYGYELAAALEARGLTAQRVAPARVYEVLRRLEQDGAVRGHDESSSEGPNRRRYRLTASGRERLDRWAQALRQTEHQLRTLLATYERPSTTSPRT